MKITFKQYKNCQHLIDAFNNREINFDDNLYLVYIKNYLRNISLEEKVMIEEEYYDKMTKLQFSKYLNKGSVYASFNDGFEDLIREQFAIILSENRLQQMNLISFLEQGGLEFYINCIEYLEGKNKKIADIIYENLIQHLNSKSLTNKYYEFIKKSIISMDGKTKDDLRYLIRQVGGELRCMQLTHGLKPTCHGVFKTNYQDFNDTFPSVAM